jgi:uncharacterized protein DUF4043
MSTTQFPTSDSAAVKLWSNRVYDDFITDSGLLSAMIKAGVVRKFDETSREAGDRIRISLRNRITQAGLIGDQVATGNENALTYFQDDLLINQIRMPISIPNDMTISQQRVIYNLPEDAYQVSMDWMKIRGVVGALYQLAGFNPTSFVFDTVTYTGTNQLQLTGLNAPITPSASRVFRPNSLTTDQAVNADTTATMKFSIIDECEAIAETTKPYIKPLSETSGIKYHLYVHTRQWQQLIQDTTAPIQYRDIFGNMIASGRGDGSIARSMVYSQTEIFKTDKIPNGVHSTAFTVLANTRRAVFCGAEAAAIAFGQGYSDGKETVPGFIIRQDLYDIEHLRRIAINGIFGIKKTQFNGLDYGVIAVPTYVAQTT